MKTKRLELVGFDNKYVIDLYELWNDTEVIKYTYMQKINDEKECIEKIQMFLEYTDKEFLNNFVILLNKRAIGIIGLPVIDMNNKEFGLYYQIKREYWGKGYASEAVNAILNYLRNNFSEFRIMADVTDVNLGSNNVLKKAGFIFKEIEQDGFKNNGLICNLVKYEYKHSN